MVRDNVRITATGCHEWLGPFQSRGGYGRVQINKRRRFAHRVAYEEAYGSIPTGFLVCHHCDNPPCVNPEHLFLGTTGDNARDASKKGLLPSHRPGATGELNHHHRLTAAAVDEIRSSVGGTQAELARRFGVTPSTIWSVRHGRNWRS